MATIIGTLILMLAPTASSTRDVGEGIVLAFVAAFSLAMICVAIFIGVQAAIGVVRLTGISEYSAALLGPIIGYLILCVPGMIEAQVKRV